MHMRKKSFFSFFLDMEAKLIFRTDYRRRRENKKKMEEGSKQQPNTSSSSYYMLLVLFSMSTYQLVCQVWQKVIYKFHYPREITLRKKNCSDYSDLQTTFC